MLRRGGRPGLIGMAARTAVVAGTATAVAGGVRAPPGEQAAAGGGGRGLRAAAGGGADGAGRPAAAPAAPPQDELTAKLEQLASLHAQGILSDEEFASAKAKALGI